VTVAAREQGRRVGGMSHRAAARLAWLLCALSLVLTALSLLLLVLNLSYSASPSASATLVPSTPSMPCLRNPTRSRQVRRWLGSLPGV
jgi:hypothetical protein